MDVGGVAKAVEDDVSAPTETKQSAGSIEMWPAAHGPNRVQPRAEWGQRGKRITPCDQYPTVGE